jgi:hypothetical protein
VPQWHLISIIHYNRMIIHTYTYQQFQLEEQATRSVVVAIRTPVANWRVTYSPSQDIQQRQPEHDWIHPIELHAQVI